MLRILCHSLAVCAALTPKSQLGSAPATPSGQQEMLLMFWENSTRRECFDSLNSCGFSNVSWNGPARNTHLGSLWE